MNPNLNDGYDDDQALDIAIQLSLVPEIKEGIVVCVENCFYKLIDHGAAFADRNNDGNGCGYNCLSELLRKRAGVEINPSDLKNTLTAASSYREYAENYAMMELPLFIHFAKIFEVSFRMIIFDGNAEELKAVSAFKIGSSKKSIGKLALLNHKKHYYEMVLLK